MRFRRSAQRQIIQDYANRLEGNVGDARGDAHRGDAHPSGLVHAPGLPLEFLPHAPYVSQTSSYSDPGASFHRHPQPARASKKTRRPEAAIAEEADGGGGGTSASSAAPPPFPPPPSAAQSFDDNAEVVVPETILGREVVTAGSVVAQLLDRFAHLSMPEGGAFDQATAALLARQVASSSASHSSPSSWRVPSVNRRCAVELIDYASAPRSMADMCRVVPDRRAFLASAGIDVDDVASVRASALRLLAHPAARQLHDLANLFHSRAPTFWAPDVEATIDEATAGRHHASSSSSTAWLGMCLAIVAIGTTNAPPLPLDGGGGASGQPHLAVLIEFGLTCYYLASEIGDRCAEYDGGRHALNALQVTSWLSTTSLFSENPHRWHCYWSFKAWDICKQNGFHRVNRRRQQALTSELLYSPRDASLPPSAGVELTMRAVWGLVIVAALQSIVGKTNRSFLDEPVECDYPASLIPPGTPAHLHPIPQVSDECFEAWSQYVHIQHLFVRMITSRLGQRTFWTDVSEMEQERGGGRGATTALESSPPHPPSATQWLRTVSAVLEARLEVLDAFCEEFEAIAFDAYAYKLHDAQPRLPNGRTDLSGWLYVKKQSQRTLGISRRRLHEWEVELADGMRLLEAMECPLPPSLSGTPSLTLDDDDEDEEDDDGASSDLTIGGQSLGAYTMPGVPIKTWAASPTAAVERPALPKYHPHQQHRPARRPILSKLRQRLSRRSALEARVEDWLANVPELPNPTTDGGGTEFKQFVTGDVI